MAKAYQNVAFSITDNGKGMSPEQFQKRWSTLDYNRLAEEGNKSEAPEDLKDFPPRYPYGHNGRGRHAAFKFSDPYRVRTWRDGIETTYEVSRGIGQPFAIKVISSRTDVPGHGTEIIATASEGISMDADNAREVIGTRFLSDPNFMVSLDGTLVTFDDVPTHSIQKADVDVPGYGKVQIVMIDTQKADRTTKQHGIAWRVKSRLVGNPGWAGFDHERILDGRTTEAKRFQFIVSADLVEDAVQPDWSGFNPNNPAWQATRPAVHAKIKEYLSAFSAERRREAKETIKESLVKAVRRLPPVGRDRWNQVRGRGRRQLSIDVHRGRWKGGWHPRQSRIEHVQVRSR
jgi:hypothetical protein